MIGDIYILVTIIYIAKAPSLPFFSAPINWPISVLQCLKEPWSIHATPLWVSPFLPRRQPEMSNDSSVKSHGRPLIAVVQFSLANSLSPRHSQWSCRNLIALVPVLRQRSCKSDAVRIGMLDSLFGGENFGQLHEPYYYPILILYDLFHQFHGNYIFIVS